MWDIHIEGKYLDIGWPQKWREGGGGHLQYNRLRVWMRRLAGEFGSLWLEYAIADGTVKV